MFYTVVIKYKLQAVVICAYFGGGGGLGRHPDAKDFHPRALHAAVIAGKL